MDAVRGKLVGFVVVDLFGTGQRCGQRTDPPLVDDHLCNLTGLLKLERAQRCEVFDDRIAQQRYGILVLFEKRCGDVVVQRQVRTVLDRVSSGT